MFHNIGNVDLPPKGFDSGQLTHLLPLTIYKEKTVSDLMREAIIRMPYEMAMQGEMSRLQFYQRAQSLLTELEAAQAEITQLKSSWSTMAQVSTQTADLNDRLAIERNDALARLAESEKREKGLAESNINFIVKNQVLGLKLTAQIDGSQAVEGKGSGLIADTQATPLIGALEGSYAAAAGASPAQQIEPIGEPSYYAHRIERSLDDFPYDKSVALHRDFLAETAATIRQLAQPNPDVDPNAPWLAEAHMLCADQGIAPGHISDRIRALRDKLEQPSQAVESVNCNDCVHHYKGSDEAPCRTCIYGGPLNDNFKSRIAAINAKKA